MNCRVVQLGPKELSLPTHWRLTTFEEVNVSKRPIGYGVVKPGPYVEGGIPLVRIKDVIGGQVEAGQNFHRISDELDDQYSRSRLAGGELLVSIQGTIGEVVVVPTELAGANISRTLARITPKTGVNTYWVKYFLESKEARDYMEVISSGSTRASYNIGDIRKTKLPLPPLTEQRKIASVLYAVDQAIQKTEAIIEQAKRVKWGLMRDLLQRGMRDQDLKRVRVGPKEFRIPENWSLTSLEKVTSKITDGTHESPSKRDEGYPLITAKHVTGGEIDYNSSYLISEEAHRKVVQRSNPEKGDILFTHIGTRMGARIFGPVGRLI